LGFVGAVSELVVRVARRLAKRSANALQEIPRTAAKTTSPPTVPPQSARKLANCMELNAVFPHGVGRTRASDQSSGKPVTTFTVDDAMYDANKGSDRGGDGVACEKA
jgi:hypothetical protein